MKTDEPTIVFVCRTEVDCIGQQCIILDACKSEEDDKIRNLSAYLGYGDDLADFSLRYVLAQPYGGAVPFGHYNVQFAPYRVEHAVHAQRMARALERIEKGLARMDGTDGAPASFGQFAARVAKILKIKKLAFRSPHDTSRSHSYDDMTFYWLAPGQSVGKLDSMVYDLEHPGEQSESGRLRMVA